MTLRSPAIEAVAASVAVMVCAPDFVSVACSIAWPLASVGFGGRTTPAEVSVLVNRTVPAYAVSVFPNWSCAITVKGKLTPATGDAVVASTSRFALAARTSTVTVAVRPLVSEAVTVCEPERARVTGNVP